MNRGDSDYWATIPFDYLATIFPEMEGITKKWKRLSIEKNAIRLRGEYQATIENNFQFDYWATIDYATMKSAVK